MPGSQSFSWRDGSNCAMRVAYDPTYPTRGSGGDTLVLPPMFEKRWNVMGNGSEL